MTTSFRRPLAFVCLVGVSFALLVGCDTDNRTDSPLQTDQSVVGPDGTVTSTETVVSDGGVVVEPMAVDATIGDWVTITGVIARHLSDTVIALEGVTLAAQPAELLLVVIPEPLEVSGGELEEGALVSVTGVVFQVTNERLAEIDESVFRDHGELLQGFRAAWGITATELHVVEE